MAADRMMTCRPEIGLQRIYIPLSLCFLFLFIASTSSALNPSQNIREALQLMHQEEYARALVLLHEAESAVLNRDELSGLLASAYLGRGHQLLAENALGEAREHFREGRQYNDLRPGLWQGEALCLYQQGQYAEAASLLNEAIGVVPRNKTLHYLLGRSYYADGRMQESIDSLTRAVELGGGDQVISLLKKARREWQVERNMGREVRGHFQLSFVDGPRAAELAAEILDILEDAYAEIGSELAFYPNLTVPVLVYTKQDFAMLTRSPDWAGGVYDGKIRIPLGGLEVMTDQLAAILYHEYTHVVLRFMTHGNLPVWLNEGVAELFGRRLYHRTGIADVGKRDKRILDWDKLVSAFSLLPQEDVVLAYQQSFSMVSFMVDQYGWHKFVELLETLGKKKDWQTAIADVYQSYGLDWAAIRGEWWAWYAR